MKEEMFAKGYMTEQEEYWGNWIYCGECGFTDNTKNSRYCGGCGKRLHLIGECDYGNGHNKQEFETMTHEERCDRCINSRQILSENGYFSACCLSNNEYIKCRLREKDKFVYNEMRD